MHELGEHRVGEALDQVAAIELRQTALDAEADPDADTGLRLRAVRLFAGHRVAQLRIERGMAASVRAAPGDGAGAILRIGPAGAFAVECGADRSEADFGPTREVVRFGGLDVHARQALGDARQVLEQRPQGVHRVAHRELAFERGPAVGPGHRVDGPGSGRSGGGRVRIRQMARIDLEGLEGDGARGGRCGRWGRRGGCGAGVIRHRAPMLQRDVAHRRHDPHVAGAPAQVAAQLVPDRGLVLRSDPGHDVPRRDQHPRGAESALQRVVARERLAQRPPGGVVSESFDGHHGRALAGVRPGDARSDRLPVHQHRAGAAHAVLAAEVGAGQVQVVAQELGELRAVRDAGAARLSVDGQANRLHRAVTCGPLGRPQSLEWAFAASAVARMNIYLTRRRSRGRGPRPRAPDRWRDAPRPTPFAASPGRARGCRRQSRYAACRAQAGLR